ncbi:vascular endothelial growth factor B [Tiliqua scincoides]|uniref:vascular endothelial growth factor B n=1 Tax=Tiliqua scincoides TaxID=71010 RepID=UPI0034620DEA
MNAPCSALQFLLATTLQLLYCAATMLRPQGNETHPSGEVIRWMDVYNRSFCQPKETMVPVSAEHPGEVEHLLVPSCVSLRRCAGCCADEELQCVPVQMHVVIMEVMKTRFPRSHLGQMSFVEHSACECRPKKLIQDKTDRPPCPPCLDRRKQLDPQTCQCRCRRRPQRCRARGLELNEHSCRCEKRRR